MCTGFDNFQKSEITVKFPKIWASCESSKNLRSLWNFQKSELPSTVPTIWAYCEISKKSENTVKFTKNPIWQSFLAHKSFDASHENKQNIKIKFLITYFSLLPSCSTKPGLAKTSAIVEEVMFTLECLHSSK